MRPSSPGAPPPFARLARAEISLSLYMNKYINNIYIYIYIYICIRIYHIHISDLYHIFSSNTADVTIQCYHWLQREYIYIYIYIIEFINNDIMGITYIYIYIYIHILYMFIEDWFFSDVPIWDIRGPRLRCTRTSQISYILLNSPAPTQWYCYYE